VFCPELEFTATLILRIAGDSQIFPSIESFLFERGAAENIYVSSAPSAIVQDI